MNSDYMAGKTPETHILIKGAKVHNLKNISLAIPRNRFVVITGLSGSGKSSLAFDTLYAEGQRRYVESLSAYARQFLGRMSKPEVEYIKGIAPAIAIEQKVNTRNPRSTVGTSTEIYEYIKLLYARIGKTYSPVSGNLVRRDSVTDVCDYMTKLPANSRATVMCRLLLKHNRSLQTQLSILLQQGFSRIKYNGTFERIEEVIKQGADENKNYFLVVDRLTIRPDDEDLLQRLADSVQTAFYEGDGECICEIEHGDAIRQEVFSNRFEADGISFEEPTSNLFSFNNPYGACKTCEGFGSIIGIDEDLVIPNKSLSVYEDAIACWRGEKLSEWKDELVNNAYRFNFPVHKPWYDLTEEQRQLVWDGNKYFGGINAFFKFVEEQTYKIQYRVIQSRYRGKTVCPECRGTRLRSDANYVKVGGKSISEIVLMPVSEVLQFFTSLELSEFDRTVVKRLLQEITNRLRFLCDVGLSYLTLNRLSSTLSGGESQRINLATSLGSSLVGSMYILDEPSIGLHPRDTHRLIRVLQQLRQLGNSVIVVEHDEEIMHAADHLIDIGPMAGENGGQIMFEGKYEQLVNEQESLTALYLTHRMGIPVPKIRRKWRDYIALSGVRENNLRGIDVKFPLNILVAVTGVSGSGKTSLVKRVLYPSLKKMYGGYGERTGRFDKITGDYIKVTEVEMVDQNPIGRSSRSNPATYVKAYDDIRSLFADQPLARTRAYKPGFFSFNIEGGRCEECEGEGVVQIGMQFMADIHLTCESCKGKRFKEEVLEVTYQGLNIADILDLTIDQAIEFFGKHAQSNSVENRIVSKLKPLAETGLGYLRMGQSSDTLSGGEAQRIKLASFLVKGASDKPTLFIFDEPTTGLHFHDISKLLASFNALIAKGHSIIVIEHNLDVIKCADWVIDLGPEGGNEGGNILFEGIPEDLARQENSYTGMFLQEKLFPSGEN
ncbi:UvrABC system protein A [bioreactor metagenome]|uniref:UvrABC system protein A n=1 Tax=bioreactor metagenome TaxID=1076179 RepID=A0A644TT07_9ZZZZ|nr:excinuclease ABC subunit UvrA [Lentimicrobium sp.]MEA5111955.1 excinuclease ABC subunit UvrA [Lentimicrobium sp.]